MFRVATRRLGLISNHQQLAHIRRFSHSHRSDYGKPLFFGDWQKPNFNQTGQIVKDKVSQGVKIGVDQASRTADQSYDLILDQTLEKFQKAILKARNLDVHKTTVSAQVSLGGVISLSFSVEEIGQKGRKD